MVSEAGSGHRAGGADLASWVCTAGTVARIDLRLPHHPRLGSPLLRYVRYNRSQARAHPASAAARQPPSITHIYSSDSHHPPSPVAVRRICSGCQQRAPRADARVAMGQTALSVGWRLRRQCAIASPAGAFDAVIIDS